MAGLLGGGGLDDPQTQGLLQLGFGLLNSRGNFGQALGQAGPGALDQYNQAAQLLQRRKALDQETKSREQLMQMQAMQLQQAQAQQQRQQAIEAAYRGAIRTPDQQAMAQNGGPTMAAAGAAPSMAPQLDQQALIRNLMSADPMAAAQMLMPKPQKLMTVAPGASVLDENNPTKPLYTAPKEDAKPEIAKLIALRDTFQVGDPNRAIVEQAIAKSTTHQPATQVSVNTAKPLLNTIAEGLGKNIDASLSAAQAAVPAIQTAQTLKTAVDTGKLIAGPGSTFRVLGLQVGQMLGVGGKDGAEVLANTRTTIQSMAKAELDAAQQMKGQGQITEAERDIIRRAASGNIDSLTAPEIRILADAMEKTSRYKIQMHKENVKRLGSMPGTAPILPFYDIQEPPMYSGGASSGVKRYNPATKKIE